VSANRQLERVHTEAVVINGATEGKFAASENRKPICWVPWLSQPQTAEPEGPTYIFCPLSYLKT
jgi:hypothetical protein